MKNYIQEGKTLELTAPAGGVVSGVGYMVGGLFAVASTTEAAAEKFSGCVMGVFEMPKESTTAAFAEGETCFWDDTAKQFNETAVGRFPSAICVAAAGATDTTVRVKILPAPIAAV